MKSVTSVALALIAALLQPAPALARQAPPPPPIEARKDATPEEIASARAQADAIMAASGRVDLFENATESKLPTIRHRPSGVTCDFDPTASQNVIVVHAQGAVSCKSVGPGRMTEQVIAPEVPALPAATRAKLKAAAYAKLLPSPVIGTFSKPISDQMPAVDAYGIRGARGDKLVIAWVGAVDAAGWGVTLEIILMTGQDTPQHTVDALQMMSRIRGEVSLLVSSKEAKPAPAAP